MPRGKQSIGIILVGSVAYSPNESVSEKSDLDLIVVYENVKDSIELYFKDEKEREHLNNEHYDGFLVKRMIDGVAVSIHNLSFEAFKKICTTDCTKLVYYRQAAKDIPYYSKDFNEKSHQFSVQSVPIQGLMGVKRIDPIAFMAEGNFVIGNDIDKILSAGIVMHDTERKIAGSIKDLWNNIAVRMVEHYKKAGNDNALQNADIGKCLFRQDRFTKKVKNDILLKTQKAVKMVIK